MSLTREQSDAVLAAEDSIAVVAGAGTGKTRVLTERYLDLVRRDVEIPRILALTFTEKAAREMKARIRSKVGRAAEFAPISTIHAFLARILRERALDAGVDPRFVIADEMIAEILLEEALAETVDGSHAALVDLAGGETYLLRLYLAARATPLEMEELRPVEADLDALRSDLERFCDECARHRAGGRTGERLRELERLQPRLLALDPEVAAEFQEQVKGGVAAAQRELFASGRALAKDYATLEHRETADAVGHAVVDALVRLDAAFTARKRAEGLLDYTDLEREGLKLLRTGAVDGEFRHLLVDEYQDTNRLQEAILERLAQNCVRFGVGDAKQSIYRFRYADESVFRGYQRRAACYPLGGSFRSRPELIAFSNSLFRDLFGEQAQDLEARAEWRAKSQPCVEAIFFDAESAARGRRREAGALARRLRAIVEGKELSITRATEPEAPLAYRHCALLLRAMTNLSVYERALTEEGVPYVVVSGRGYYAAREVVDLAFLLLLLADPYDHYRAVAVLTSLLCGVPEADLVHLPGDGPLPLRALGEARPLLIPPDRWDRLVGFGRRFESWRAAMGRSETGDLVERILDETRFADLLLLERDGRRRHANLRKALRRARQAPQDPAAFARGLLEFRDRERRESEAPIAAEADEAVKIMTVHAAKGLEFPLVAVGDLTAAPGRGGGAGILRPDGVFGFGLREGEPMGLARLKEWDKEQERLERVRLLYVALTRAEEHLILSGASYKGSHDPLRGRRDGISLLDTDELEERPRRRGDVRAAVRRGAPLPVRVARDEEGARRLVQRVEAYAPREADATPYVAAVADLVEFHRCPRRYRLGRMLGIEMDEPGGVAGAGGYPRRLLGTAFHEVMRDVGPGAVPDRVAIRKHLPDARPADIRKIRNWSAWLGEQEVVRSVADRKQHREMPFLARIAGMPVRGVIDLYVPSVPLLLDYKTSVTVRAEEYGTQVAIYLAAIEALGFSVPDKAHLVYVDAREIVEVSGVPLAGMVARFRAAHRGAGAFPPLEGPACLYCDFKDACLANGVACPTRPATPAS